MEHGLTSPPSLMLRHLWPVADQIDAVKRQAVRSDTTPQSALDWALRYALLAHPLRGLLRFADVARDYQKQLLADTSRRIFIVKSRQIGISQTLAFVAAHEALNGGTVVVVSRTGEQAQLFLSYVYAALHQAPHPVFTSQNKGSLEFQNGGKVITQGATRGAGRGVAGSLVILDEFAWMEYADDIYTAVMPTLANGGRAIICTTPNGRNNKAYQMYASRDPQWSYYELKWDVHPEWRDDPAWKERTLDDIGREAFAQEHDCDFAVSGGAVFDPQDIEAMFCLDSFAAPERGRAYLSTWDLGRKHDATVGVTWDITRDVTPEIVRRPYRIVAFERLQHASYPEQQAAIEARHRRYPGRTVVESNGVGDPVIQNLLIRVDEFVTTARSKKDAIDALQLILQRHDLQSPPIEQVKRELSLYERNDQNLVQDCVLALAIGAYTLESAPREAPAVLAMGRAKGW